LTSWPVGKNEAEELAGWQVDTLTRETVIHARGPEAQLIRIGSANVQMRQSRVQKCKGEI